MKIFNKGSVVLWIVVIVLIIVLVAWLASGFRNNMASNGNSQLAAVATPLLTADNFTILAGSAIVDTNISNINSGDVGLSPGTNFGALTTAEVAGTIYAVDASGPDGALGDNPTLVNGAKVALTNAFNSITSQPTTGVIVGDLGVLPQQTLTPGVYDDNDAPDSLQITGTLTLDGQGDPNAVFIFKTGSTLTTAAGSIVNLINSAQACNVFWQIGSSATFGSNSTFKGTILANVAITDSGGSNIEGRLFANTGAVTLNNTTITKPTCITPSSGGGGGSSWVAPVSTITVIKTVVNDNGETKIIEDFPLFVNGKSVVSGITNIFRAPVLPYFVTEKLDPNYTQTFSGDCNAKGELNLNYGENKFCIITNDDVGVKLPDTGTVPPLIDVEKIPSVWTLPSGPGPITYTYKLHNIGTVPMKNITMVGDTCSPITRVSGDLNVDSILDVDETWIYSCSTNLSETHTNTVVATGWANGISAVDIASVTVVVGVPIVPPIIHVTKVPNPFLLLAGGGIVTYTEKISNPGKVALSNISLIDDKCSPMKYISGDTNNDSKLDISEIWLYSCKTNITKTTTNTAVAEGIANGILVRDFAVTTVVVADATPGLPDTGFAPRLEK